MLWFTARSRDSRGFLRRSRSHHCMAALYSAGIVRERQGVWYFMRVDSRAIPGPWTYGYSMIDCAPVLPIIGG